MAWYPARGGGIPASVKTDMNAVLNKKFGTVGETYPPKEWTEDVNLMGLLPIRTASGTIAHFEDGADDVPLKSLTAQILPIQEGTGDPSPSNPRPISGTSVLNVEQRGKNFIDFLPTTITSQTRIIDNVFLKAGNYTFSIYTKNNTNISGSYNIRVGTTSVGAVGFLGDYEGVVSKAFTLSADSIINVVLGGASAGYSFDIKEAQIELGTTATTYEPYTGSTYTVNLGRTVYGGSANVTEGEGEGDSTMIKVKIKDLDWSKHAGTGSFYCAVSDKVVGLGKLYCEVFNPVTGNRSTQTIQNDPEFSIGQNTSNANFYLKANTYATKEALIEAVGDYYICYELATPTDFTFEGEEINSYLGVNNIYVDSGEVLDVEYRADMNLLIASLEGNRGLQMTRSASPVEEKQTEEVEENETER